MNFEFNNILESRRGKNFFGVALTIAVVFLLIIAGPASAINLNLGSLSENNPKIGEEVSFIAQLNLESADKYVPIESFYLSLTGAESRTCVIDNEGNTLSGNCAGLSFEKLQSASDYGYGYSYDYGYGYGYSNGVLSNSFVFNVSLNSSEFSKGDYNIVFGSQIGGDDYQATPISLKVLGLDEDVAEEDIFIVNGTTRKVIFNGDSENVTEIVIQKDISEDEEVELDLSSIKSGDKVTLDNKIKLTREGNLQNYSAEFEAGTEISSSGWSGKLNMPTIKNSSNYSSSNSVIDVVVNMGTTSEITFSKPVKVVIGGQAGKSAVIGSGASLTQITTICDSAVSAPTNIDSAINRECFISSGNDLIIWTYHFTNFGAVTKQEVVLTGGSTTNKAGKANQEIIGNQEENNDVEAPIADNNENNEEVTNDQTQEPTGLSRITGAVIGTLGGAGTALVIIFILLIMGLGAWFGLRDRKASKKKKSKN